jgi:polyisoprenyl-phosphate glycosyltransferase
VIERLEGPIAVFGAGGFIGVNLLLRLLAQRTDVVGVSQSPRNNWRFLANGVSAQHLRSCDITEVTLLELLLQEVAPRTIFVLSAYGAYSRQREYRKIYRTNFNAVVDLVEALHKQGFSSLVHAGSSSEYGLNASGPTEDSELVPNSHYALSKVATSYALKYYGRIQRLPVVNLRIYSAYGAWEEPDRLVPQLVSHALRGEYPPLVDPDISRDFIHVEDVCDALISAAAQAQQWPGHTFNVCSGSKTTLRELATLVGKQCGLHQEPVFGTMPNREWDLKDWYGSPEKARKCLGWRASVDLAAGLRDVMQWQRDVDFAAASWNWTRS